MEKRNTRKFIEAGNTKNTGMRRTRLMSKISPIGLILFVGAIVGAILIGSLFTVYYVQMSGDMELNGNMRPLFFWDDTIPFAGAYCNRTVDVSTMDAGDTMIAPHSITNADAGAWVISFDTSDVTFTDPENIYYGFYFSINDTKIDGNPVTAPFIILPGEKMTFNYCYELDPEFVTAPTPLDFNVTAIITRTDPAPIAVDDTVSIAYGATESFDIVANDYDLEGQTVTLVSVGTSPYITCSVVDGQLQVYNSYAATGHIIIDYVISDGHGNTDTGSVDIYCHM